MNKPKAITVTLALDVEEEGLFCGNYQRLRPSLQNISHLNALKPFLERGIKPTLFCAWPVFQDREARKSLDALRKSYPLEIGAHLHFWNTPPLAEGPDPELKPVYKQVPSARVNPAILNAKIQNLLAAANDFNAAQTTSFRMGRWDLHRIHWPMLMRQGIKCDASVRPFHYTQGADGPDHFDAPQDPYLLGNQYGYIYEVPLTVASWLPFAANLKKRPGLPSLIRASFSHWGAIPLLAIEHPLPLLKLTSLLHIAQGGKNLSLTWHSSEMMPKGAPHMPDATHIKKFLSKMEAYFSWLEERFTVSYETMETLRLKNAANVQRVEDSFGDWSFPAAEIFELAESDLSFL